ncbi:CRAL-TRIO domain-containing protein [Neurospora tetraspora]|uniref:CRAL-TRIO domain-containing protein n=1 Tax=Neurospora tetraspora TaxID=94610 RepID=A0AAE0MMG7_9PEZI|nr:CRAL-TRIO domain-containing protein [Neurospora tetraspora]
MTGSVANASAASGTEVGYPNGHLGHLKPEEQEALESFKTYLAEKGYYKPGPPASHDEQTLLRYLRARRWNVVDAFKQFKETEDWRKANDLNVLYDTIDLEAYEASRRLYPQWTGRRDRRGIPLYLFEIRHLDSKTVSTYEKAAETNPSKAVTDGQTSPKLLRLFALYENLTRFAQPLCTELPDRAHATTTPITLSTNIVDVSGVSLRQFWNLKSHMQAASQLATAHYPETLDRIFIIGAPSYFSTVWGWIKRWFDPITVSKIFIVSPSEVKATLEEFIDPKNIPKQYGGELEFTWGDQPKTDPFIKETVRWENGLKDFPEGPKYWRPTADGTRMECVAVGSEGGKQRMVSVGTVERICNVKEVEKKVNGDAETLAEEVKGLSVGDDEKKEVVETGEGATVPAVSA